MKTVILLVISNLFMVYAWYGHLRAQDADTPMWKVVLLSWGIAFFEYCFMIPANRWGIKEFNPFQLRIIQEVIGLTVFTAFAWLFLKEQLRWNYLFGFGCLMAAVYFIFKK